MTKGMGKRLGLTVCLGLCLLCLLCPAFAHATQEGEPGQAAYADRIFDRSYVHRIDVQLDEEDWAELLADPTSKTKYPARVVIDGEPCGDVTFSTKGFSSLYFVAYGEEETRRYSFKVNFGGVEKGRTYHGLDKLSLNNLFCDNTWMKDPICYDLFRDAGVEAPLVSYAWLTVNGADQGLYMAVEDIKGGYLDRVYQGEGVIYSVESAGVPDNITAEMVEYVRKNGFVTSDECKGADLVYTGNDAENYTDITDHAETDAVEQDHREVIAALRALSLGENVGDYFDIDEIIRFFAAHNYVLNYDSYTGQNSNNLKLHLSNGRLSAVPWDYNLSFGTYPTVIGFDILDDPTWLVNRGIDTPLINTSEEKRPLWQLIHNNPDYLNRYHEILSMLTEGPLAEGRYEAKVNETEQMLLPWIQRDPTAFCGAEEFETACETLKQFLAARTESVGRQLAGELSPDSEKQAREDMVDASDIHILSLGALVLGTGE